MHNLTQGEVRQLINKGIKVLAEAADIAVHLKSNPGPIGWISVGAKVANAVNEISTGGKYFTGWEYLEGEVGTLGEFLCMLCVSGHLVVEEHIDRGRDIKNIVCQLGDVVVGWEISSFWKSGPFVHPNCSSEDALEALGELAWQMVGSTLKYVSPPNKSATLIIDSLDETLPSRTADQLWERQEKFIKAGYRRSVLVWGEPGTGKSHLIRHMTSRAGGRSLRLRAQELQNLDRLGNLLRFLKPSGVLIDDFDRIKEADGILEEMDEILTNADLLLVTVNHLNKLDAAAIRRFDDIEQIQKLDDGVLDRLLAGISEDMVKVLRDLPITYIQRYRAMHHVLGESEARVELTKLLAQRDKVLTMMKSDEESDDKKKNKKVNGKEVYTKGPDVT